MRRISGPVSLAALALALMLPGTAQPTTAGVCGLTTLDATLRLRPDGTLECAPGRAPVVRDDLAPAGAARTETRRPLLSFVTLADFQLADEESPLRTEWLDKCPDGAAEAGSPAGSSSSAEAFRPHETMVPHLLDAHVRAVNAIAAAGSPVLRQPISFVTALGDLADNQQYNETRQFIDILDGGLVDPDSGADGYDGVQGSDPKGKAPLPRPVAGTSLRDLANEPFWATGLRAGGARIPWYSVIGSHDVKVQGSAPDDNRAWRTFARAWAVGALKIQDLAPDHQQRACSNPHAVLDPAFWMDVAADPGTAKVVPPDANRRLLARGAWMRQHSRTRGLPAGHGFGEGTERCRDAAGKALDRGCYSFDRAPFHFVALDTSPSEGDAGGNIDDAQFRWLERVLERHSSSFYADGAATPTRNPRGEDRLIVVMSHHDAAGMDNAETPGAHTGADLETLLLRFPNVILHADGHAHRNTVAAHRDAARGTGYWEIGTAGIADFPSQSRTIEVADNGDGTLSVFAVAFDAAVPPDARTVRWTADDPTDDPALGKARRAINEVWLAAAAREVAYNDPDADSTAAGTPADRNVELLLKAPFDPPGARVQGGAAAPRGGPAARPPSFGPLIPGAGFPGFRPPSLTGPGILRPGAAFPPPGQPPFNPYQTRTERGLGAPSAAVPVGPVRAALLLLGAMSGALWLARGRVREWMLRS